jgi:hydrogenase maturation factor
LLLTLEAADAERVCGALAGAGIEAAVIGRVVPRERGTTLWVEPEDALRQTGRRAVALPTFARDEITRLFE